MSDVEFDWEPDPDFEEEEDEAVEEETEEFEDDSEETIVAPSRTVQKILGVGDPDRKSLPILSIYELSGIISKRIHYLDCRYKSTMEEEVKRLGLVHSIDIALLEFRSGKIPEGCIIRRPMPDGSFEDWELSELKIANSV